MDSPPPRPPNDVTPTISSPVSNAPASILLEMPLEAPVSILTDANSNSETRSLLRIWPIPIILVSSLAFYILASVLALVVAAFAVNGRIDSAMFGEAGFIQSLTQSKIGFPLIVVIPQIAMIIPVLIAASLSPQGFRDRLNLVRGHWPIWLWGVAAIATPLIGMISSAIVGVFMKDSESLLEMTRVFRDLAGAGYLVPLAFLIGLTPGICEELLFRGYIQSRLTTRWNGVGGVLLTSIVFAAFHMDIVHSTAVFALGVWLGWICWQSGSIFPAMLAHFVNNAVSVFAVSLGPEPGSDEVSLVTAAIMLGVFFLGSGAFLATLTSAWRYRQISGTPLAGDELALN